MKQEAKGKLFVGMMVSIVAFGFATGAGVFMNTNPLSSAGIINLTHQSDFPTITTQPSSVSNSQNSNIQNSSISNPNNVVPNTNTNTPSNNNNNNGNSNSNSTKTPPKTNTTSNTSG